MEISEIYETSHIDEDDAYVDAIAAEILPSNAALLLEALSLELPLSRYGLHHLKRIRKDKLSSNLKALILLCPFKNSDDWRGVSVIDKFVNTAVFKVPKYSPNSRQEFESWRIHWPINFRPSELDRDREKGFKESEKALIESFILDKLKLDEQNIFDETGRLNCGAVMVNPVNNEVRK